MFTLLIVDFVIGMSYSSKVDCLKVRNLIKLLSLFEKLEYNAIWGRKKVPSPPTPHPIPSRERKKKKKKKGGRRRGSE